MVTEQDIEGYLIRMGVSFDLVGKRTWMIRDSEDAVDNLVVTLNDPIIVFSVKLAVIPEGCDRLKLYEELLRLNAREMLHGAYGLEGNSILATDTLQAEHLDFNEFQASVDALNLCITSHYRHLQAYLRPPTRPRPA
ncbi:MAG: YbjN domain-containing protein [Deltaproteobacteria bacterium]|nr:YbjN domain-containing protein [Deltaproteobacteria bacterium]